VAVPPDAPAGAPIRVRRADVDMNRHVNNTRYIAWLLEQVPPAGIDVEYLTAAGIDVEYRAECGIDDEVHSRAEAVVHQGEGDGGGSESEGGGESGADEGAAVTSHHALLRKRDGAEVLRARVLWRPPLPQLV
jgi:hypothetical protein